MGRLESTIIVEVEKILIFLGVKLEVVVVCLLF